MPPLNRLPREGGGYSLCVLQIYIGNIYIQFVTLLGSHFICLYVQSGLVRML